MPNPGFEPLPPSVGLPCPCPLSYQGYPLGFVSKGLFVHAAKKKKRVRQNALYGIQTAAPSAESPRLCPLSHQNDLLDGFSKGDENLF